MAKGLSPMMTQYLSIKEKNKDCILMFRLGDFYEMFFDDAKTASAELELVLTGKDCGLEERAPMCGIPYHSCEAYIARLVEKGYKVAICEQVEDPATAKGIVKRDVVRVITPGTVIEESMLDESSNNYLCAICEQEATCGITFVDSSTGETMVTEIIGENIIEKVKTELGRFMPREVLLTKNASFSKEIEEYCKNKINGYPSFVEDELFDKTTSEETIKNHFKVENVTVLGLTPASASSCSLSAVLEYLYKTQMSGLARISKIKVYSDNEFMKLDYNTIRNLELVKSMRNGDKKFGTLLWVLNKTKSALGKRLITKWIEQPLINFNEINERHNSVEELIQKSLDLSAIRELLTNIHDIERILTRMSYGTANAREMRSLCFTAAALPDIKQALSGFNSSILKNAYENFDELSDIKTMIDNIIVEEPPVAVKDGGIVKEGVNEELDFLRSDLSDGQNFIRKVEEDEREKTGIKSLKVRYNKVFGYYIEVTNLFKDKVPEHYIRKQTLVNGERYITEELKNLEARVLGAKERSTQLEYRIFEELRLKINEQMPRIQRMADILAQIDALCSLATVAQNNNYCRPIMNNEGRINIQNGRHPVVEQVLAMPFVPNDTQLDNIDNRCAIITGPNMAGKSTYMRQVALAVIMAQIGSFVPASYADISITDAVFTRIGASDDLTTGQSTFMVEMSEVAYIIKNATDKSLLILDEIGRGTSTYDGMSIARAVLEHVSNKKKIGAKTLFATHYHELTVLEGILDGVKNYNVAVKKHGDDITFLRRIVRGGADESYGIEVAKLSGIPETVIKRAKQILKQLEQDNPEIVIRKDSSAVSQSAQMSFVTSESEKIIDELRIMDVNTLTPIEAMSKLFELSDRVKKNV